MSLIKKPNMKKIYIVLLAFAFSQFSAQNCAYLTNGNFDTPFITSTSSLTLTVNGWSTTATDGKMEVWATGNASVTSYSGSQFVELNATQAATMYQDFSVATASVVLSVKFAHRARTSAGQTDSMKVEIGPVGGPYTSLGKYGDGPSAWGYYTANYNTGAAGNYRVRFIPIYWGFGNVAVGNFLDDVSVCLNQSGINELTPDNSAFVYPNPANESVSIKFENDSRDHFYLNVYDQQGRLVKIVTEITSNEVKFDRENLNSGFYFYTLSSDKKIMKGTFSFVD
jgi:hypothetical protein